MCVLTYVDRPHGLMWCIMSGLVSATCATGVVETERVERVVMVQTRQQTRCVSQPPQSAQIFSSQHMIINLQ